jgi:hypothetical protein
MTARIKLLCVAGARPNFMKLAPLARVLDCDPGFAPARCSDIPAPTVMPLAQRHRRTADDLAADRSRSIRTSAP